MDPDTPFRISLGVILIATMCVTVYHRLQAAKSGDRISHREEGHLFAIILRLVGVSLWFGILAFLLFPNSIRWAQVPMEPEVRWYGVVIGGLSPLLMLWTLHHLGKNLTDTVVTRAGATLVTTGPYRWVRHPFYVTVALFLFSATLISANYFLALSSILVLAMLAIRTPNEEQRLIDRFGDAYREYSARTGRFFPRIGS